MLRIGLTGGMGSGKSTVAAIFELLGIPVYYADAAAKRMMLEDPSLQKSIIEAFGKESYQEGILNREYLAKTVFADPVKLAKMNALVHPITIADAASWMQQQKAPYTIKEAALLFESRSELHLDYVIGVEAPLELRISRVLQRDPISREQILARMNQQMNEQEKIDRCNFIIHNNEQELLIPQVIKLHETLLTRV